MLVDTYRSTTEKSKLSSGPAGTDISTMTLSQFDADYSKLAPYQKTSDLDPDESSAGFNNATIIQDITDHGLCAHFVAVFGTHNTPRLAS